jgi:hypothetical protein
MRSQFFLALIVFCSLTVFAGDNVTPLNLKEGLWEVTTIHSMSGMPAMANLPPDALAKLPPDQRAKVEAMMSGRPNTDVRKECVTKEKLAKNAMFSKDRGDCTRTVVSSTGSRLELKIHCQEKDTASDGTLVLEALTTDGVKGTMHLATNSDGQNIKMDFTFSSKYLGPACGDVK